MFTNTPDIRQQRDLCKYIFHCITENATNVNTALLTALPSWWYWNQWCYSTTKMARKTKALEYHVLTVLEPRSLPCCLDSTVTTSILLCYFFVSPTLLSVGLLLFCGTCNRRCRFFCGCYSDTMKNVLTEVSLLPYVLGVRKHVSFHCQSSVGVAWRVAQ